jgi:alanine-synthesizing transaminase
VFSRRTRFDTPTNRLTLARQALGGNILDLTESNPTRSGISYPLDELEAIMGRAARVSYTPDARGTVSAREALSRELRCDPDDLVLTASTSEAYGYLFKLLSDPGDNFVTATPSYPLLEHLASLELVELRQFPLEFHRRWELDPGRMRATTTERTRAILVVNPNNPTGSYVTGAEQDAIAQSGLPIVSDEVFLPFALDGLAGTTFAREDVLSFTLGGLSKSAGLPHYKLGWIRVSGPGKTEAVAALELIADNFLSVATPVQAALPDLLQLAPAIRNAIRERTAGNLQLLRTLIASHPEKRVLPVEGGWSAVLRFPNLQSDEELALELLGRGVLVHPGYFFDFEQEGHVVISLLTAPEVFAAGVEKVLG